MSDLLHIPVPEEPNFPPIRKALKQAEDVTKEPRYEQDCRTVTIERKDKRVRKACERCRIKKTKCDRELPCKRCKEDRIICIAGSKRKTESRQLPSGYAEMLENTHRALVVTVQKLYTMVRNKESWDLGEPQLDDRGQPVIHDIAFRLGCIRPSQEAPSSPSWPSNEFVLEQPNTLYSTKQFTWTPQHSPSPNGSLLQPMGFEPDLSSFADDTVMPYMLNRNCHEASRQMNSLPFVTEDWS